MPAAESDRRQRHVDAAEHGSGERRRTPPAAAVRRVRPGGGRQRRGVHLEHLDDRPAGERTDGRRLEGLDQRSGAIGRRRRGVTAAAAAAGTTTDGRRRLETVEVVGGSGRLLIGVGTENRQTKTIVIIKNFLATLIVLQEDGIETSRSRCN